MSPIKVNNGQDVQAAQLGGDVAGLTGTATSTSSTSLTNTGASFTSALVGHIVVAGSAYGVILSVTSTVLTIDRWYNPASPGGSAASTPSGTATYVILPGGAPAMFVGITTNATAASASDTTLTSEITTAGGGLIRKIATFAHTPGANTYTLTVTFTANGSDSLPAVIAKYGVFTSLLSGLMVFETVLSATATLTASGDALTITITVTQ